MNVMKKIFFSLILLFGLASIAKADTIEYWHIYYNQNKLKECNQYSRDEIVLHSQNIKPTDCIFIYYFQDAPCSYCDNLLFVENEKHEIVFRQSQGGNLVKNKLPLSGLLLKHIPNKKVTYLVYFQKDPTKYPIHSELLFKLIIE